MVIEFGVIEASFFAIVLPLLSACVFLIIIPSLRNMSGSRIRRYVSYLITPPKLDTNDSSNENKWRADKVKLFFYYIAVILFLTSFMIGEFYEVMIDLFIPITQGNTGATRFVSYVVFQSPFNAGWIGSLPWIGRVFYHDTWNWIFFTSAIVDNPDFLSTIVIVMTLISIGAGFVYLAPLVSRSIRNSFLPSMFFLMTGMAVFTKVVMNCLAYAFLLAVGNIELEYNLMVATGSMIPGLWNLIAIMLPIILAMFLFFLIIARRLWRAYYTDTQSMKWFMLYITLSFWLGLIIAMLEV